MPEKSSVFDMIGPVMIGPSSSHTAGVVRIGLAAHKILGAVPEEAEITFYNSFARTYEGHGSDRAILAGLMGFLRHLPTISNQPGHKWLVGLIASTRVAQRGIWTYVKKFFHKSLNLVDGHS